ncbi:hypothetical protein D3C76_1255970 [compost metagenome]
MGHAEVTRQTALQLVAAEAIASGDMADQALRQLALDDGGEEVVLRREVAVEGAAGEADGLHQSVDPSGGETAALGNGAAAFQQLLPGFFLVSG